VSALAGGSALYAWCRIQEEERQRGWRLYGWFSALMLCGSCFGAVSWAARMTQLENVFNGNDLFSNGNRAQGTALQAVAHSWRAVFAVTYAIEFLCLSTAKLMVLDRMSDFAAPREDGLRRRWVVGGRVVMAVVVLGNAVGLAASAAAAVHSQRAAEAASTSSALFAANNTQAAFEYFRTGQSEIKLAASIESVQSFCEVAVLLVIVAAFVAAGVMCARRIRAIVSRSIRRGIDVAIATQKVGDTQKLQMVATIVFVFAAFLLRAVFSIMLALANQFQEVSRRCPGVSSPCSTTCDNVFTLMQQWMFYTPEFQVTVVLVSSPDALLVALWGMTNKSTLLNTELAQQMNAERK
jgi:hypothetical protein